MANWNVTNPDKSGEYLVKYTIDSCKKWYNAILAYDETEGWLNYAHLGNGKIRIIMWTCIPEVVDNSTDVRNYNLNIRRYKVDYPWGYCITLILSDGNGMVEISKSNDAEYGFISGLKVLEEYRGKNRGNSLLELAEKEIKDMGLSVSMLNVVPDTWVERWYLRRGYTILRKTNDGFDELIKTIK